MDSTQRKTCVLATMVLALALAASARAQTSSSPASVSWRVTTDGNWFDNGNWSSGAIPGATDTVRILGENKDQCDDDMVFPTISADTSIGALELEPCARLTISGATLTISSALQMESNSQITLNAGAHIKLSTISTRLRVSSSASFITHGAPEPVTGGEAIGRALLQDLGFKAASVDVAAAAGSDEVTVTFTPADTSQASGEQQPLSSADTRLTIGMEEMGAASASVSSHLLVDLMVTAPLFSKSYACDGSTQATAISLQNEGNRECARYAGSSGGRRHFPWVITWMEAKLNGVPRLGAPDVQAIASGVQDGLISPGSNESVQGMAFSGGFEIKLADGPVFGDDGHYQFEPALIVGAGAQTPFTPSSQSPVLTLTDAARTQFDVQDSSCPSGSCTYIAFVPPDRTRFYRQYFFGLRLKTHHFDCPKDSGTVNACQESKRKEVNFPGIMDVTFGQDEAVSGGSFKHVIATLSAFYPLPFDNVSNTLYLFGAMHIALSGNRNSKALLLAAAPGDVKTTDSDVYQYPVTSADTDRDYWSLGFGVDLVSVAKWVSSKSKGSATGNPTAGAATTGASQ